MANATAVASSCAFLKLITKDSFEFPLLAPPAEFWDRRHALLHPVYEMLTPRAPDLLDRHPTA